MPEINRPKKKRNYQKNWRNSEIAKIYNTTTWRNLRKAYLMKHPLCENCLKQGKITPASQVHHIYEISNGKSELEMKDIAFNPNNLQSLCEKCHKNIHNDKQKKKEQS